MSDDMMKRTREWLQSCVNAATRSGVPEEADLEAFILAHIDGEPARTQAAVERKAEDVREACAQHAAGRHEAYGWADNEVRSIAIAVRNTPLTATPLADELDEAQRGEREAWRQTDAMRVERDAARSDLCEAVEVLRALTSGLSEDPQRELESMSIHDFDSMADHARAHRQLTREVRARAVLAKHGEGA